jgi:transposase
VCMVAASRQTARRWIGDFKVNGIMDLRRGEYSGRINRMDRTQTG